MNRIVNLLRHYCRLFRARCYNLNGMISIQKGAMIERKAIIRSQNGGGEYQLVAIASYALAHAF